MYFAIHGLVDARTVRPADGVDDRHAVVGQQVVHRVKEPVVVTEADMFEHTDRNDAVELLVNVPVVLQAEFDLFCQPQLLRPLAAVLQLLFAEGNTDDPDIFHARQVNAQSTPAAADIQHPLAGGQCKLGGQMTLLGNLGLFETCVGSFEIAARILPVRIQKTDCTALR